MAAGKGRIGTRRKAIEGLGIGLASAMLVLGLWALGAFEPLDLMAIDAMQRAHVVQGQADPDIVLLAIDDSSLAYFKEKLALSYPWPRDAYAHILRFLDKAGVRGVFFDLQMRDPSDDREEVYGDEADMEFVEMVERMDRGVVGATLRPPEPGGSLKSEAVRQGMALDVDLVGRPLAEFAQVGLLAPRIAAARARFGFVNAQPDGDGLIRRTQLVARVGDSLVPSLALAGLLKDRVLKPHPDGFMLGDKLIRTDGAGRGWIRYRGPGGVDSQGRGRTFRYVPIANVLVSAVNMKHGLEPEVDPSGLRGKWIIIGSSSDMLMDLKATPFSPDGSYPGMEIHASILDNLLRGDFLWRLSGIWVVLLILLLSVLVGLAGRMSFVGAAVVTAFLSLGVVGFSTLAFSLSGLCVDLVTLEIALLLAVFSSILASSLRERRGKQRIRNIFQYYLDPVVVRSLIERPDGLALGGERRVCTVFFSDIAGFTSISEQLSAERLVEMMNKYLGAMTDIILRNGGFLDKYIGDAIMAVFGAPANLPNHAEAAGLAALECHQKLEELSVEFEAMGLPKFGIRVGLNTGTMIVGNMGSEQRMNYTAMGDAVNLGSRLEGANKTYGTVSLVGPETYRLAGDQLLFRELDLLRVKGKQEPVCIYELVGLSAKATMRTHDCLELFARGLRVYRERKFDQAETLFAQLHAMRPEDGPTLAYLERCRRFVEESPPDDWDGVYTMTGK